jgi:hopanoid biosynthesis associated protein HpnK
VKRVILTGDDFGLSIPVNEAIEKGHREGILTTASLMVGGRAASDAIDRARRFRSLKVGLHLVLVDGRPVLPPEAIPDLVGKGGRFPPRLARSGLRFFFAARIRQQLGAEIEAQFRAFVKAGLSLDHVNTHHHMHLHPTVSGIIMKVGRDYGMKAMRLPYEPPLLSWRAARTALFRRFANGIFLSLWTALLKSSLRRARISSNRFLFGMNDSGHMEKDLFLRILNHLPQGVSEIYFHPSAEPPGIGPDLVGSPSRGEFETLTSPEIRHALQAAGVKRISFSDLLMGP